MTEGNIIAALALIGWPIVSLILFKRLPMGRAILGSILLSYLFLPPAPAGIDLPLFPELTKDSIPNIVMVILCMAMAKEKIQWLPSNPVALFLVLAFVFAPLITVMTNTEPVVFGLAWLPGLRFVEAVAICMQQALFLAPMLLARHFLSNEQSQRDIMLAFMMAGLVYSLPALVEIRLSPQMNVWVYGFFQHSFEQTVRFGGFRPLVFLYHGIWLAFFLMTTVVASVALFRGANGNDRIKYAFVALYLAAVLVLCKSAGAVVFAIILIPLVLVLPQRWQVNVALVIVTFAFVYPIMKLAGLIPTEALLQRIAELSLERSNSLRFRFDNEDTLLARALEKPLFGWGTWGRNHILDPVSGALLTVTDGRWIIVVGVFGWLGYVAEFGLLALPIWLIWLKGVHHMPGTSTLFVGPMCLILAVNTLDLIPNATITPLTWLFAGAILGYSEQQERRQIVVRRRPKDEPAFQTVM